MSKKHFKAFAEALTDEQMKGLVGVGATLREFGKALEEAFLARFGVQMTCEERAENEGKPNILANPVIDVEVPGVMCLMLKAAGNEGGKTRGHGYANDVGLSDKVKTGNVPPTLLAEILLDSKIQQLGGSIANADLVKIQEALKECMTITDGKFAFDKKKAPPLNNPVEVAEWMQTLKTSFVGTTNGATHVDMEIIPIPIEYESTVEPISTSGQGIPSQTHDEAQHSRKVDESPPVAAGGFFDSLLFQGE